jgi:thiamine biosynthesis lipoprotein
VWRWLSIVAASLVLTGCSRTEERLSAEFFVMGGLPVHVTAWDVEARRFERAVADCRRRIQTIEAAMSVYRDNSLVSRANRGEKVELDEATAAVVRIGLAVARRTGGAFDPTVGPLVQLWQAAGQQQQLPTTDEIEAACDLVGWDRVLVSLDEPPRLRLEAGARIDLGGVAKGLAADAGLEVLQAHGIRRALVELGGDLALFDRSDDPRPFTIGVRHPLDGDRLLGRLQVADGGVVTSGSAERFVEIGGARYGHIVDPRTGYPVEGVLSATVIAPTSAEADAVATALMVLGPEAALDFVASDPAIEAVLVVDDPSLPEGFRVEVSAGAAGRFSSP